VTDSALTPRGRGEWLLRLQEWTAFVHAEPPGQPAVLAPDPVVERQVAALAELGGLDLELLRNGFRVQTRSFVGRVQVGALTIVIEPKIPRAPMIELLRYAFGLRGITTFDRIAQGTAALGFEDLVALELAAEVSELVARGLTRRYVARDEELTLPRGRIDFERLARTERTTATLPCRHHLRLLDAPLNRALLMGLEQARRVSTDGEVRALLHRLELGFEGVTRQPSPRSLLDAASRQLDRTTSSYAPALSLIDLLLDGAGVVLADGRMIPLRGFLFDMNRFFQALLGRFLRDHLAEGAVLEERPLRGMLRWDSAHNPQGLKDPLPRPDFAVRMKGQPLELLDAKYQDLAHGPPSREVVYQLAMYALSRDVSARATVLHPGNRVDREQALLVCTPTRGDGQARIVLRPVDLEYLHGLLSTRTARRERIEYAQLLAFG
jgi:5-methylcytosine-specific restriction enzyme subunit McrC